MGERFRVLARENMEAPRAPSPYTLLCAFPPVWPILSCSLCNKPTNKCSHFLKSESHPSKTKKRVAPPIYTPVVRSSGAWDFGWHLSGGPFLARSRTP